MGPPARALCAVAAAAALAAACSGPEPESGHALFATPQVAPLALSPDGRELYVANTAADTVAVVDTAGRRVVAEIAVGLQPASLAVRPDGLQLVVANHLSDSVAVVDTDPRSATRHRVVQIVQDLGADGVTRFDEPLGMAFASDAKAYVALSSRNQVAVLEREGARWQVRPARPGTARARRRPPRRSRTRAPWPARSR